MEYGSGRNWRPDPDWGRPEKRREVVRVAGEMNDLNVTYVLHLKLEFLLKLFESLV